MRIIAGRWRGKALVAPPGTATRPTSERMRQAIFDMIWHASWGGRAVLEGVAVLDAFAGTGAMGLEALSRGAGRAAFIERDRAAIKALRANVASCGAEPLCRIVAGDAMRPSAGAVCGLVFLDPPYGEGAVEKAVAALTAAGWIGPGSLIVAESARDDPYAPVGEVVATREHGAARVTVWRPSDARAGSPMHERQHDLDDDQHDDGGLHQRRPTG